MVSVWVAGKYHKMETKKAYVVTHNSDLTEGKGHRVIHRICESEVTALRLSKGIDVQGCDGSVLPVTLYKPEDENIQWRTWWYGPVKVEEPSKEDRKTEELIRKTKAQTEAARRALARAKELGLSAEEIAAIASIGEKVEL